MSIKNTVNLKELTQGGTVIEVEENFDFSDGEIDDQEDQQYKEALLEFTNLNCMGEFEDEPGYNEGEPFEKLAKKMIDIVPNKIKKKIIRDGYGQEPEDKAIVKINYNAYIEYQAEPYDSTYARKNPQQFTVNNGEVIIGLDIAVQSMKINEKSQFLVKPEFAYGKLGCLNRVPANATIFFEIELLEIIEAGAAVNFDKLSNDIQKDFNEVYKYCLALCVKGKELFGRNIKSAIVEYNKAVSKLETSQLKDFEEQEKQQELLLKLYSNLLVCYTKTDQPKRGCINFNKINDMLSGTSKQVPAKAYYNNARCLRMLGDYDMAKKRLQKAYAQEPKNSDILTEFKILDNEQKKYLEKQKQMGKALFNNN